MLKLYDPDQDEAPEVIEAAQKQHSINQHKLGIFLEMFQRLAKLPDDLQDGAHEMVNAIYDPAGDQQDKILAYHTLLSIFFDDDFEDKSAPSTAQSHPNQKA